MKSSRPPSVGDMPMRFQSIRTGSPMRDPGHEDAALIEGAREAIAAGRIMAAIAFMEHALSAQPATRHP